MNIHEFALGMGISVTHIDVDKGTAVTILPDDVDCAHPIDRWVHTTFTTDSGREQDSYDCGLCGALMQVG